MTICWFCKHSCVDQCCWASAGQPVPGWTAESTLIDDRLESYEVIKCPQFTRDDVKREARDLDTNGCINLLEQLIKVTRKDYIRYPSQRCLIIRWMESDDFNYMTGIENPEGVIREFKEAAKKHDEEVRNERKKSFEAL